MTEREQERLRGRQRRFALIAAGVVTMVVLAATWIGFYTYVIAYHYGTSYAIGITGVSIAVAVSVGSVLTYPTKGPDA